MNQDLVCYNVNRNIILFFGNSVQDLTLHQGLDKIGGRVETFQIRFNTNKCKLVNFEAQNKKIGRIRDGKGFGCPS